MKLFTRLAMFMARSKERHGETNQETSKSKKKTKSGSTSKKRRKQPQIGLKPCLKQPNATPKKRKWSIKFLERVTVYEVEEIIPKQKKQPSTSIQSSDKISKTAASTNPPAEYKTRLNIFYERLAR